MISIESKGFACKIYFLRIELSKNSCPSPVSNSISNSFILIICILLIRVGDARTDPRVSRPTTTTARPLGALTHLGRRHIIRERLLIQ
jgi:hypothetical protein